MSLWPLIVFHICAGTIGLLSGAVAMSLRKGSRRHRLAGDVFVISMLCMSGSGATVGFIKYQLMNSQAQLANFFIGVLTFYLVATAWWAARRRDGETGIFDWVGLLVALSIGAALVISGLEAAYGNTGLKHDFPVAPYFVFGSVALLSAAGDVRMLARGGVSGAKRIVRHLWRVSFAFLIAAFSFFLGQQKVMPAYMRGSKLLFVPPLLILIMLIYWLCRMWFTKTFRDKVIAAKQAPVLS
ncbi:MAG TPA: DUF2306 domain-containing protein [Candidatus Eremiobacteraceae bacterium]|nr:DUF2306 domain-containing protein [Candidatus Eremiobacteraceae bacterium]